MCKTLCGHKDTHADYIYSHHAPTGFLRIKFHRQQRQGLHITGLWGLEFVATANQLRMLLREISYRLGHSFLYTQPASTAICDGMHVHHFTSFCGACIQVGHGEFVTEWPANFSSGQAAADASSSGGKGSTLQGSSSSQQHQQHAVWLQELPAHCRDLASVVMGQTPVNFVHKSKVTADAIRKSSNGNGVQPGHHLEGVVSKVDAPTEWN
jgi:hypothetical protein